MIGNNKKAQFVTLKVVVKKKMEVERRNQNLQSQHKHLQPQVLLEKQNPALKLRHPLQHLPQHPLHNQLQHKLLELLEKQNPALKLRHPLRHPLQHLPQHPLHNQLQHKLKQLQLQPQSQLTVKPLVLQKEPSPRRKQKLLHKHQPP